MNTLTLINILQIVVGIALIILVLLQRQGGGLGSLGGGSTQFFSDRRGIEEFVFDLTVILTIVFIGLAIMSFLV